MDYNAIAQMAYDSGAESPFILSSNNDMAHRVGIFARLHGIYPHEIKPSRGYTWILNRNLEVTFTKNSQDPEWRTKK